MVRIDETQEAIARIRMVIDDSNKAHLAALNDDQDMEENDVLTSPDDDSHWTFGSPGQRLDSRQFEEIMNSGERGREF